MMKKSVKAILILVVAAICVYAAVRTVSRIGQKEPSPTNSAEGSSEIRDNAKTTDEHGKAPQNAVTDSGFVFSDLFSCSGAFVEDGSDEQVDNVAAVKIKNVSRTDCRYAKVKLTTENDTYEFSFTTLGKGQTVTVLEQNRKKLEGGGTIISVVTENNAGFVETPQLYPDVFELTVMDKVVNVKNISGKDIGGTVYIYYKNTQNGELFGGITYRIAVDSLKAGELKQASSQHLSKQNSVMEFITYVP